MSTEHAPENDSPLITAVVVHVTCNACALDDEFEFEPRDIIRGVEISHPCSCGRRIAVTAEASAIYRRVIEAKP